MADISVLARLIGAIPRNVDIASNTLVTTSIKVGGGVSNTELTKAILDRLVALQNGSDVDATYHTHDGRYFTETELSDAVGPATGSDLIGDDDNYTNITPTAATVKGALEGIDAALAATADEKVAVSAADTTPGYLAAKVQVDIGTNATNALEETIQSPGGDEIFRIRFDASKVDHGALTGLGDDDHTIYTKADGTRAFTGDQSMGGFKLTNLAAGSAAGHSVRYEQVILRDGANAFTASQSMGSFNLTNVADPVAAQDAATKAYVDSLLDGRSWKQPVRVASTADIDLAVAADPSPVDGVTLADGDRILLKDQTAPEENGIYVAVDAEDPTTWVRSSDANTALELAGAAVFVEEGTANADKQFAQTADDITLGTDPVVWVVTSANSFSGHDMISLVGGQISVDLFANGGLESSNPGNAAGQLRIKSDTVTANTLALTLTANGAGTKYDPNSFTESSEALALAAGIAGSALSLSSGVLSVNVDDSTIEVNADALRVKAAGINENHLAASVAGNGLTGGAGSPLAVGAGDGIDVAADAISVDVSDLAGSGLENDGSNNLRIAAAAAGAGLIGGGGSALAVGANADGSIVVNADDIQVAHSPMIKKTMVAGESFAADTTFVVRMARTGETAGRVYKADYDATSANNFYAIGVVQPTGAVSAGQNIVVIMLGEISLLANDVAFAAGEVGEPVHLKASGAWDAVSQVSYPDLSNLASVRVGMVQETGKIMVQQMQLNGIA
jgi:hypothetical protein